MTNVIRKEKVREINKNDIIDAAERLFFDKNKGYAGTTMDDLAIEAQFSKRTLYTYFESKEEIYFEIMIRGYRLMLNNLNFGQNIDAMALLIQMGKIIFDFSVKYSNYFWAIMEYENSEKDFTSQSKAAAECYALGEQVMAILVELLNKGVAQGVFKSDANSKTNVLMIWSFILGVFNTIRKKANYLKNIHNIDCQELLKISLQNIQKLIVN